jgi:ABC-type sugar transport system substrate-binding protein
MPSRRIALFLANPDNDYMQALRNEAEAAAARAGFELEVAFAGADPGKISIEQPQQIYRAINRDPAVRPVAVIVFPLLDVAHTVKEVVAARVGVIVLNRLPPFVEELRNANPGVPIFAVSSDQVQAGRVQGRQLRTLLPEGGLVLGVLGNPLASSTSDRANGLRQVIDGSAIRLTTVNGDWGAASGEDVVTKWLRQPWNKEKLAAIACQNDAMAMGARKATRQLAAETAYGYLQRIPILGIDGSPHFGLKLVESGDLTATVVNPLVTRHAIEQLARALKGEAVPPFLSVEPKPHPAHLGPRDERTQSLVLDVEERLRRLSGPGKA